MPLFGDDAVADIRLPLPRYPEFWNDNPVLAAPFLRPASTIFPDRDAAVKMIRSGGDVDARTVMFDACVNDGLVSLADSRIFLSALRLSTRLTQMVDAFRREFLGERPTIGPHIRHGNGAATGHDHYWHSFQDSKDR